MIDLFIDEILTTAQTRMDKDDVHTLTSIVDDESRRFKDKSWIRLDDSPLLQTYSESVMDQVKSSQKLSQEQIVSSLKRRRNILVDSR